MNALTKLGDYIKSRCTKNEQDKSDGSRDDKSDQTPLVSNIKKRPQMDISEYSKEEPIKKLKLSRTSAKKVTIIDLTQDTEDESTPVKHSSKKDPVIKIEFPPGSMVKLKARTILNKRNRYDEIDDFYAVVADPDKELPVHLYLPADKTCVYIGWQVSRSG